MDMNLLFFMGRNVQTASNVHGSTYCILCQDFIVILLRAILFPIICLQGTFVAVAPSFYIVYSQLDGVL